MAKKKKKVIDIEYDEKENVSEVVEEEEVSDTILEEEEEIKKEEFNINKYFNFPYKNRCFFY